MFLIYIDDLPLSSHDSRFILFADDTTSLTPCLRNTDIQTLINNESPLIVNWFVSNHLALNFNNSIQAKQRGVLIYTLFNYTKQELL